MTLTEGETAEAERRKGGEGPRPLPRPLGRLLTLHDIAMAAAYFDCASRGRPVDPSSIRRRALNFDDSGSRFR
jgi:hypothetical protein